MKRRHTPRECFCCGAYERKGGTGRLLPWHGRKRELQRRLGDSPLICVECISFAKHVLSGVPAAEQRRAA
ncbi:hypothetical protein RQ832_01925 [Roseomonas sp. DSM 102946]|nr:hypothetical protein [Roseomonas sp. DSM 102946]